MSIDRYTTQIIDYLSIFKVAKVHSFSDVILDGKDKGP